MSNPNNHPSITVLICARNEEANLPYVLPGIPDAVDEIILVDGHSEDGTVEAAKKLRPAAKVICQPGKGKGDALKCGVAHSSGDIVVTLDADGSNDPREILKFVEAIGNGCDFAKSSRFLIRRPQMAWYRRFGNWVLATETNLLFGTKWTDVCSGYNAFSRKSWDRIDFPDEFGYEPLILLRARKAGLKITEIPCDDRGRISGTSKLPSWRQGWLAFKLILKERFRG